MKFFFSYIDIFNIFYEQVGVFFPFFLSSFCALLFFLFEMLQSQNKMFVSGLLILCEHCMHEVFEKY